jgi:hypothetical protein
VSFTVFVKASFLLRAKSLDYSVSQGGMLWTTRGKGSVQP